MNLLEVVEMYAKDNSISLEAALCKIYPTKTYNFIMTCTYDNLTAIPFGIYEALKCEFAGDELGWQMNIM